MRQAAHTLVVQTRGAGLVEITGEVTTWAAGQGMTTGLLTLFCRHTSASLTINENADPDVRSDMARWFDHAVPEDAPYFVHTAEGSDDMPAHLKASLLGASVSVPIRDGRLALGTWQGVWLFEHRARPPAESRAASG